MDYSPVPRQVREPDTGRTGRTMAEKKVKNKGQAPEQPETIRLPVLPLFEVVVFPRMMQPIQVGRQASLLAVDEAVRQRPRRIILLTKTDSSKRDVGPDD